MKFWLGKLKIMLVINENALLPMLSIFFCLFSSGRPVPETEKDKETKPRSLRFTWSMRTTSAMDPNDMMKEIRKVCIKHQSSLLLRSSPWSVQWW